MGGQACILYGAAEFSRDLDLAVLVDAENLRRLQSALDELQAEVIAVPPFGAAYLERGLAVHFRCRHPDAAGVRVDVMAKMRGVAPFDELWMRRTTLILPGEGEIDLLALPDLVQAKKTQRDKDWPMIRRLVEVSYLQNGAGATSEQIAFWFRELRTPPLLQEIGRERPDDLSRYTGERPGVLTAVASGNEAAIAAALHAEEFAEREKDRLYWLPLRAELEGLRRAMRRSPGQARSGESGTEVE